MTATRLPAVLSSAIRLHREENAHGAGGQGTAIRSPDTVTVAYGVRLIQKVA